MTRVELDKPRNLKLGFKAMMIIEKQLHQPLAKLDFQNITFEQIAAIAYGALSHEDNSLTFDRVVEILDECTQEKVEELMNSIGDEMGESFGKNPQRAELEKVAK
jgi:hypothetical protein